MTRSGFDPSADMIALHVCGLAPNGWPDELEYDAEVIRATKGLAREQMSTALHALVKARMLTPTTPITNIYTGTFKATWSLFFTFDPIVKTWIPEQDSEHVWRLLSQHFPDGAS